MDFEDVLSQLEVQRQQMESARQEAERLRQETQEIRNESEAFHQQIQKERIRQWKRPDGEAQGDPGRRSPHRQPGF